MIVGIPKEIKNNENRVAITPAGVVSLVRAGHEVLVENGAGAGSGIADKNYKDAGARIIDSHAGIFELSEMVMKVKEPIPEEYDLMRKGQILFTYLHLANEPVLTKKLLEREVNGIAYETIQCPDGSLPLLAPMSEIAGRMSVQIGAHFLEKQNGGKGVLLSGVPGVPPAEVIIIGGGVVGANAAKMAAGLGARVTVLDNNLTRLKQLDDLFPGRVKTVMSNEYNIENAVREADLLIGCVLIPGARAPKLVTGKMVQQMTAGSVIVDVAIDQGGSIETIDRVTTHSEPVYEKYGVIHYAVANMPGAVARTSTYALTNATLSYALELVNKGCLRAIKENAALAKGVNTWQGKLVHKAVGESLGLKFYSLNEPSGEFQC